MSIEKQICRLWAVIENDSRSVMYLTNTSTQHCIESVKHIRKHFLPKKLRPYLLSPTNSLELTDRLAVVVKDFDECMRYCLSHHMDAKEKKLLDQKIVVYHRVMNLR
jgi:hypothetical protein